MHHQPRLLSFALDKALSTDHSSSHHKAASFCRNPTSAELRLYPRYSFFMAAFFSISSRFCSASDTSSNAASL